MSLKVWAMIASGGAAFLLHPLVHRMTTATLWVGKMVAPRGYDREMPTGLQDGVTPTLHTTLQLAVWFSYLVLLVSATAYTWWLGLPLVMIWGLLSQGIGGLLIAPKRLAFYLRWMMHDLRVRSVGYMRTGDVTRATIADDLLQQLIRLHEHIRDQDPPVPNFASVSQMPLQGGEW